jgi:hypothetical protein
MERSRLVPNSKLSAAIVVEDTRRSEALLNATEDVPRDWRLTPPPSIHPSHPDFDFDFAFDFDFDISMLTR